MLRLPLVRLSLGSFLVIVFVLGLGTLIGMLSKVFVPLVFIGVIIYLSRNSILFIRL